MRASVIGAGAFGTAMSNVLSGKGFEVKLWARNPDLVRTMAAKKENVTYLPGVKLEPRLMFSADLGECLQRTELVVLATPSHAVRETAGRIKELLPVGVPIVVLSKGIENESLLTMTEVLEDVLPVPLHPYLAVLSGPSFAKEVAARLPTMVSVAATWERIAKQVQLAFSTEYLRCYTSADVMGVQLGGSLKNVIAIAAGAADGLGFGHNARAGLITRGLAEISRVAMRKGANPLTLSGLAGMGDLVLTCTGELSRNRTVGFKLGQGRRIGDILADMKQVAEGVKTARSARDLAKKIGVEMPITEEVFHVLYDEKPAKQAVVDLMKRELKAEL